MPHPRSIPAMRTKDDVRRFLVKGTCSKYDIVRVTGLTITGAHQEVEPAAPGALGVCWVANHDSDLTGYVEVTAMAPLPFDTSSASKGDPVYLSETTAGSMQLSAGTYGEVIGVVGTVGPSGDIGDDGVGLVLFQYGDLSAASVTAPHALDNHTDVTLGASANGEVLTYNGSVWENAGIPVPTLALDDLTDVTLGAPASGEVLTYNGSVWENVGIPVPELGDLGDVDLTGNASDYVLAWDGAAFFTPVDVNTLTSAQALNDLTDATITYAQPGNVLTFNGTAWVDSTDYRPDAGGVRATIATDGTTGEETIYVDNSTGFDTNTGSSASPFATIERALNTVPHSRDDAAEETVYIQLASGTGTAYTLPYTMDGASGINIYAELPTATTFTISTIDNVVETDGYMVLNTNLSYTSDDERQGDLLILAGGRRCAVVRSLSNGGSGTLLWIATSDPEFISTGSSNNLYAKADLVTVDTVATGDITFRNCAGLSFTNVHLRGTGGAAFVGSGTLRNSDVTLTGCVIGGDLQGLVVDSRSALRAENTVFEASTSATMVDNYGELELAGALFQSSSTTDRYPLHLRNGSRTNFEGVCALRTCYAVEVEVNATVGDNHTTTAGAYVDTMPWIYVWDHSASASTASAIFRVANSDTRAVPQALIALPSCRYGNGGNATYGMVEVVEGAKVMLGSGWFALSAAPSGSWGETYRFGGVTQYSGYGKSDTFIRYGFGTGNQATSYIKVVTSSGTVNWDGVDTLILDVNASSSDIQVTLDKMVVGKLVTLFVDWTANDSTYSLGLRANTTNGGASTIANAVWPDITAVGLTVSDARPDNIFDLQEATADAVASVSLNADCVVILQLYFDGTNLWVVSVLQTASKIYGWLSGSAAAGASYPTLPNPG